ncbi:C2H2 finger domain-containing protein [Colletotrichum tofieldiae]|nr:C2H2 finger domain-containing protein [Colletotrichum tofieldiae]
MLELTSATFQPQQHPVQEAPPAERHDFESFARHLQDAAMLIQRQTERAPYDNVSVLLLRWEEDTSVEADLTAMENILRSAYNFRTDRWVIPTVPNPSIKLGVQMASFLEQARANHLLIIYYAGYGYVGSDNQLYWACNTREDAAKLKWDGVRCLFEDAQSDILLLLDTCSVRDVPVSGSHGIKQAIAACGPEQNPEKLQANPSPIT